MVLPKKITAYQSDLLMDELLICWRDQVFEDIAFPSDQWLDDIWVYEPYRRDKIRRIFSDLITAFDDELKNIEAVETVRFFGYDKITYRAGSLCVSKATR